MSVCAERLRSGRRRPQNHVLLQYQIRQADLSIPVKIAVQQLERGGDDLAQHDALHDQQVGDIQLTIDRAGASGVKSRARISGAGAIRYGFRLFSTTPRFFSCFRCCRYRDNEPSGGLMSADFSSKLNIVNERYLLSQALLADVVNHRVQVAIAFDCLKV